MVYRESSLNLTHGWPGSVVEFHKVIEPLTDAEKHGGADRNFKGPFYTLRHVRYRLKRDTGVLERGLGSVSGSKRLQS